MTKTSLRIIAEPALTDGFRLSGVEAYGAEDARAAEELIAGWLERGEKGLIGIQEDILDAMDEGVLHDMENADGFYHIAIPSGRAGESTQSIRQRLADQIEEAVGVQLQFGEGQ